MVISYYSQMNFYFILIINLGLIVQGSIAFFYLKTYEVVWYLGQFYLPNACFMTFNNVSVSPDPSNPNPKYNLL